MASLPSSTLPLHDATAQALKKVLDASALRHRVIAHNLANVETPGFKAADVPFAQELRAALQGQPGANPQAMAQAMAAVEPQIVFTNEGIGRRDGNTVDVDMEMTDLTENAGTYQRVAALFKARQELLRIAITEGRR